MNKRNIIYIASGKGGVGKTWFSINLAHQLASLNQRVLIIDADFGLANVDIQLGLMPQYDLSHLMRNNISVDKIIYSFKEGNFDILPGRSGTSTLESMPSLAVQKLKNTILDLGQMYDFVLVDMGAGIHPNLHNIMDEQHNLITVITPESTSLTDGYAFIKTSAVKNKFIVVNSADTEKEAQEAFHTIFTVTDRFLNQKLTLLGYVQRSFHIKESIRLQKLISVVFPTHPTLFSLKEITHNLLQNLNFSVQSLG